MRGVMRDMGVVERIDADKTGKRAHASGAFPSSVLKQIEKLLPTQISASAETGCGKSTILFSNVSDHHTVFTFDDRAVENSSINYFQSSAVTRQTAIELILGYTQLTLPAYKNFRKYDLVLIDGPHGFPFPELEYYYLYPHLNKGALLIIDDVHIATVGRLADFINEDPMFELVSLISSTAIFKRTNAATFDPLGDGWCFQDYNRRRIPADNPYMAEHRLEDAKLKPTFASKMGTPEIGALDSRRTSIYGKRSLLSRFTKR
jgi:predicted O-methyltransferase YrrM